MFSHFSAGRGRDFLDTGSRGLFLPGVARQTVGNVFHLRSVFRSESGKECSVERQAMPGKGEEIMRKTWVVLLAILVAGAGCSLPPGLDEAVDTPVELPDEEGLRWEEDVADHPPAPQRVEAIGQAGVVRITWAEPIEVAVPHTYSDAVAYYRVFRRLAASSDAEEIGTTDELLFEDTDPPASGLVFYHVTALHEGGVESDRSDETRVVLGSQ
jgi:hypothetical protein